MRRVKLTVVYAFIALNLATIVHNNYALPAKIAAELRLLPEAVMKPEFGETYSRTVGKLLRRYSIWSGNHAQWSMFSPGPKENRWTDWYAIFPNERLFLREFSPLRPDYAGRADPGTAAGLEERALPFEGAMSGHPFQKRYADYIFRQLERRTGARPLKLLCVYCRAPIPVPGASKGWTPDEAPIRREVFAILGPGAKR